MAERDQLGRPLRRHDPGELRGDERVALRERAKAVGRGGRDERPRHRAPGDLGLRADVDHPHRPGVVDV